MIEEKTVYRFRANLWKGGEVGNTMTWDFQVLAEDGTRARNMLLEYLEDPKRTGIKYKKCVGLIGLASELIVCETKGEWNNGKD